MSPDATRPVSPSPQLMRPRWICEPCFFAKRGCSRSYAIAEPEKTKRCPLMKPIGNGPDARRRLI